MVPESGPLRNLLANEAALGVRLSRRTDDIIYFTWEEDLDDIWMMDVAHNR